MKLITFLLAPLYITSTLAATITPRDDDEWPVPGNTKLSFCNESQIYGPVHIENVSLNPSDPTKGGTFVVHAKGTADPPLTHGTKVKLKFTWAHIHISSRDQEIDLCAHGGCPLSSFDLQKEFKLPKGGPVMSIRTEAKIQDDAGNDLTCMKGKIT